MTLADADGLQLTDLFDKGVVALSELAGRSFN